MNRKVGSWRKYLGSGAKREYELKSGRSLTVFVNQQMTKSVSYVITVLPRSISRGKSLGRRQRSSVERYCQIGAGSVDFQDAVGCDAEAAGAALD